MQESNEVDTPVEQTKGMSVVDLPESNGDATSLAVEDTVDWSSDVAFLSDTGGLNVWRNFTATLTPSLDATQDQLPKLTLEDGHKTDRRIDSSAVIPDAKVNTPDAKAITPDPKVITPDAKAITPDAKAITPDTGVVDKPTITSGGVSEFEDGQAIPGEPPRITDPLPAIPPGIRITIPKPTAPGFGVIDPAHPSTPGIVDDPSLPIKAGVIADPIKPVEPVTGPGTRDLDKELNGGLGLPGEPPRITDPLPIVPPSIRRIVDHGALTGRKHDAGGAPTRQTTLKDASPAGQAVTALRANLRAAEAQNLLAQNSKLAAQIAAQMELKKHGALPPEKAIKEGAAAAALLRKAIIRGVQGGDKGSAVKRAERPKAPGNETSSEATDDFVAKPTYLNEKAEPHAVRNADFANAIHHERSTFAVASSLPVEDSRLRGVNGRALLVGVKFGDDKAATGTNPLPEPAVASKTYLPELTLVGNSVAKESSAIAPQAIEPQAIEPQDLKAEAIEPKPIKPIAIASHAIASHAIASHAIESHTIESRTIQSQAIASRAIESLTVNAHTARLAKLSDSITSSAKPNVQTIDFTPATISEKDKIFLPAQTPIQRSLQRRNTDAEGVTVHASNALSILRYTPGAEDLATHIPVERINRGHASAPEQHASRAPAERIHRRHAASSEQIAAHVTTERSLLRQVAGADNVVSTMPLLRSLAGTNVAREFVASAIPQNLKSVSRARLAPMPHPVVARADDLMPISSSKAAASPLNFTPIPLFAAANTDRNEALPVAHGSEALPTVGGEDFTPIASKFKSLLSTANTHKSSPSAFAQTAVISEGTLEQKTVKHESGVLQKDVSEKQLAKKPILLDHAEYLPAKFSDDLKLRVTYLHIGNRIFLLERQLVDKNTHSERPAAPPAELVISAGVAALIAGRRLKRRRKNGEALDNTDAGVTESVEEESLPTNDSNERSRESVPLSRAASRFSYMIQPGDSLTDLATAIWHDAEVGWLIAEVNKLKQEWQGSECSITLVERQVIDLPLPQEVVDFYRSGVNTLHKRHKLTTIVTRAAFDDDLSSANSIQYSQSNDAASALKISHSSALMFSPVRSAVP